MRNIRNARCRQRLLNNYMRAEGDETGRESIAQLAIMRRLNLISTEVVVRSSMIDLSRIISDVLGFIASLLFEKQGLCQDAQTLSSF